jgi:hypothetical protein
VRRAEKLTTFVCRLKSGSLSLLEPSGPAQAVVGLLVDIYVLAGAYFIRPWAPYRTIRDVTPGPLSATDTYIVYKRHPSYALRKHICGSGLCGGRGTKKTKAIRCGACYYSIVLNAHRVTSMACTDIDTVRQNTINNTD